MAMSLTELQARLDQLDNDIPRLKAEWGSEFWAAFAGQADEIEDNAGNLADWAQEQVAILITKHRLQGSDSESVHGEEPAR